MANLDSKKAFVQKLGFKPKNNSQGIYSKNYSNKCILQIDFEKETILYDKKIKFGSKTTQNFSQEENWVVLECVDRLLEKGYKPEDLILEKVYPTGHGTSGRLDILVYKNKKAYLMIECKTWGEEFKKEFKNLQKNGGQLFTYFQQDRGVEYLILYASKFENNEIQYRNEIIKIEESYKETSNVNDFYDRWNKLTKQNGVFEEWVVAYDFQSKALMKKDLIELTKEDSNFIFHEFLSILRKHSISDKPNAFNKIFNLFLSKIFDEKKRSNEELEFQWIEGKDNDVNFQVRLINLYKKGMAEFLKKEVEGILDDDFRYSSPEELEQKKKKWLKFNNILAIKEVIDDESFEDNALVLREIVELLQRYKIRYPRKQQYLSDFFELLLTTGLKQESGQFFTPPPVAKFIIKSIPLKNIICNKLKIGDSNNLLPRIIDYAAGSGHFLTESMEEMQSIIANLKLDSYYEDVIKNIESWKIKEFGWASKYIYGIEKDYRLVKTAKVGCYFYGDGVAQVIHGDGLDDFEESKSYVGALKQKNKKNTQDNSQFDIVISNPPYSVSSFKSNFKNSLLAEKNFELYKYLTDQSSEIECLFVERTKQLLKEEGIAGIILPSSILSNSGIYTKTREIILKYFDIIAIVELGSNTFMATDTNTVILFLKKRKDNQFMDIGDSINTFVTNLKDITVNEIENVFSKYIKYVWKEISFNDYISIFKKNPTEKILNHEIYKEYKRLKLGKNEVLDDKIIELEKDKLLHFILTYPQKIVLVKSGEKNVEKAFLGYEFSNRRGSEGIHPIQRGKQIDECTKLFDSKIPNNPKKVSTYIYDAFENNFDRDVDEELHKHVSRINLIDMMSWDRNSFEKTINLSIQEKIDFERIWKSTKLVSISEIADVEKGTSITKEKIKDGEIPVIAGGKNPAYYHNQSNRDKNIITISASGAYSGFINYFDVPIFASDSNTIRSKNENTFSTKLIFYLLKHIQKEIYKLQKGQAQPHVYGKDLEEIKIPLPNKQIREKIIKEFETLEKKETLAKSKLEELNHKIINKYEELDSKANKNLKLSDSEIFEVSIGKRVISKDINQNTKGIPVYSANVFEPFGFIDKKLITDFNKPSVLWGIDGDWMVNYIEKNKPFYPTDHCGVLRINENKVNPIYMCWLLKNEGKKVGFSRDYRASIDRIKGLNIKVPPIDLQNKIIKEVILMKNEILKIKQKIEKIPGLKEEVLNKYL